MSTTTDTTREEAHKRAKAQDVRKLYDIRDTIEVVLEQDPETNGGRVGVAHRNGIVIFVHPGKCDLGIGAHLSVRVSDVDDSYMHAVTLRRFA